MEDSFGIYLLMARMFAVRRKVKIVVLLAVASVTIATLESSFPASAAEEVSRLVLARQLYDQGRFNDAAENLRLLTYEGKGTALSWLLLGQSYFKLGHYGAARQALECVEKYFPRSAEALQASAVLKSIPSIGAKQSASAAGAVKSPARAEKPDENAGEKKLALIERVQVVAPRFGHQSVSEGTIVLVKDVVKSLPVAIYKILDRGGVNIYLTPNLIDRFPEAVGKRHPKHGTLFSAEYGRTYDRDVYICEHLGADGGGYALQPQLMPEVIKNSAYNMLAHALDYCLETPSKNEQFLVLYKQDLATAEVANPEPLKAYLSGDEAGAGEVFATLTSALMGNNSPFARSVTNYFPRCRVWIQSRIEKVARQ